MCYELLLDSFLLDTKEVNQKLIDRFGMDEFQEIKKNAWAYAHCLDAY